ncbi:MAG: YlxR family protein [Fimbriimonadaceae bacterium]|nr:YlxR family protein [Fimbriimonadaceae bacterium]
MCAGCRKRFPQGQLTRIRSAIDSHELAKDEPGRGRSVYHCSSPKCKSRVLQRVILTRSLRRPVSDDQVAALQVA